MTNVGRRRRTHREDVGYWIDTVKGAWLRDQAAPDATPEDDALEDSAAAPRKQKVIPYVEDRRNVLVLRLAVPVSQEVATTLRYALERGIEAAFQLEDSELSSEALPDPDFRARMLFTESAEGGAGVLRRLQDEPAALAVAAREALRIAHFDPDTGKDLDRAEGASERCERGCYDCLLSYGNQLEHALVDRHAARDLLLTLAATTAAAAGSGESRDEQLTRLLGCGSGCAGGRRWRCCGRWRRARAPRRRPCGPGRAPPRAPPRRRSTSSVGRWCSTGATTRLAGHSTPPRARTPTRAAATAASGGGCSPSPARRRRSRAARTRSSTRSSASCASCSPTTATRSCSAGSSTPRSTSPSTCAPRSATSPSRR